MTLTPRAAAVGTLVAGGLVIARWMHALLPLGYLGWDSYPILATSRIGSVADLVALLGGRLMGDVYPGAFYRPLTTLTIAVEQLLGGPDAAISALVHVALLAATAALLYRLARRLVPQLPLAAALATLVYLLHPSLGTVLPYLARRPDLLANLFLVAMATVAAGASGSGTGRPSAGWRRSITIGLLALAAMASKETGLVAPMLLFALAALFPAAPMHRWRSAFLRVVPAAAAAALYLAARYAALGSLGGHRRVSEGTMFGDQLLQLAGRLLSPRNAAIGHWLLVAAAAVTLVVAWRRRPAPEASRTLIFGAFWVAAAAMVLSAAGRFSIWYPYSGLLPFALSVGVAVALPVRAHNSYAVVARLLWVAVAGLALATSPVLTPNPEWRAAAAEAREYLGGLEGPLAAAQPGEVIQGRRYPKVVKPLDRRLVYRDVAIFAPYSIRGWASLRRPDLEVRVARRRELRQRAPAADELTIELRGGRRLTVGADGEADESQSR